MSIFQTRILLATNGSEEAELAALRAVELAQRTDSELHVVHVGLLPSFLMSDPATRTYDRRLYEEIEEESRELLRKLSWRMKVAGGTVPTGTSSRRRCRATCSSWTTSRTWPAASTAASTTQ